jgi:hypothetical protein
MHSNGDTTGRGYRPIGGPIVNSAGPTFQARRITSRSIRSHSR